MPLAGPSAADRFFRMANAAVSLAPVPWLPLVTAIIKEIYDLIVYIKLVKPQCRQLAEEAEQITTELKKHEEQHPGDSKLADIIQLFRLTLLDIRTDLTHWANYNKWMRYWRHRDVLGRIEFHQISLSSLISSLTFKGVLIHDIESAQMRKAVEDVEADIEEIRQRIDKDSKTTEAVKEDWRATSMIDIDSIEAAEERIFSLRLNPDNFPSADMKGEIVKNHPHFECQGDTFDVFKAIWLNRKFVAAKRFRGREYGLTPKQERRFTRQMNIMRSLQHPNILPVFGVCRFEANLPPYLISPWMKYGNVRNYLKEFPGADKLKLIHEVAIGLQYIHSLGILHGNLNPTNVLVNIDHRVRLTGFSLSKELQGETKDTNSNDHTQCLRWWSPETIKSRTLSEQSDVWSWGMTALEILSGEYPYKQADSRLEVFDLVLKGEIPGPEQYDPKMAKERIWTLIQECWMPYGSRADVEQIVSVLHEERTKEGWNPNAPPPEPKVDMDFPESF